MIDRRFASVGKFLFLAFVLLSLQALGLAQTEPQIDERAPVEAISFKDAKVKTVLVNLARQMKLGVTFDESVRDRTLNIDLRDVTLRQAIEIILQQKELTVKMKDDHTLFIFADTPENRDKYSELEPWPEEPAK